jgi:hypothetical protein
VNFRKKWNNQVDKIQKEITPKLREAKIPLGKKDMKFQSPETKLKHRKYLGAFMRAQGRSETGTFCIF